MTTLLDPAAVMRSQIVAALRTSRRPRILGHVGPDGDVLGSASALSLGLRTLGADPKIVLLEPWPELFGAFEPEGGTILVHSEAEAEAAIHGGDAVVVVDNNDWKRLGGLESAVRSFAGPVLCLDHHPCELPFSPLHLLDVKAAATAIVVYDVLRELGIPLTPSMADALYVGIVNDTGWFRHSNTDPRVFATCMDILNSGGRPSRVAAELGYRERIEGKKLLGAFLATIELRESGRVAMGHVTRAMMAETGGVEDETEDFVNQLRSLRGTSIVAFLRETTGGVKISLRSRDGVSARRVAQHFGGGGHVLAAGAFVAAELAQVRGELAAELRAELARSAAERDGAPLVDRRPRYG